LPWSAGVVGARLRPPIGSRSVIAEDAESLLDELEGHLDGAADAVRPALLRALTRLRKIAEEADDSPGSIGAAWQRAADLYARSCREGNPDRVNWRRSSPNMTATWTAPWSS